MQQWWVGAQLTGDRKASPPEAGDTQPSENAKTCTYICGAFEVPGEARNLELVGRISVILTYCRTSVLSRE